MINNTIWAFGIVLFFISCGGSRTENSGPERSAGQETTPAEQSESDKPVILFFGNSITAGYQLEIEQAFPALIGQRLDSLGYKYQVVNAGLSGETTAGGLNRIDWVLQTVPDIFFLELGANDGLRGLDLKETKKNLLAIIEKVRKENPQVKVILAGMEVPPNLGVDYTGQFRKLFPEVAEEAHATLIPFLLEGVAGNPDLNLKDGIHPTPEGHRIVAETVWKALLPLLEKKS